MIFLYDNAIDDYTLTATLEETGYPITNIQDTPLAKKWRSPAFDNLIDRGDCENTTPPMIFDETVPYIPGGPDATFARDGTEEHGGTYSYKATKTIAAGTGASVNLVDNNTTSDMHGLIAGRTYTFSVWVYLPTASGIAINEVSIAIRDYDGGWAGTSGAVPTSLDTWQKLTVTRTIRVAAIGTAIQINMASAAANTEYFYVDDIELHDVPQIKIDAGSNNVISAKSFAIGGHNLTGGAKITIEGNAAADFDTPSYSDELIRNLIISPEDLTASYWGNTNTSTDLTNLYVKNKRLTQCVSTANANGGVWQVQYANNTTQSFQAILRKGNSTDSQINYHRFTSPYTGYGAIIVTWATKAITSANGLTNLEYEWIDDDTVWVAGTANSIDISLVNKLTLFVNPTDQTTGKYVYATAMMVEDNSTVTKYDVIHSDPRTYTYTEASYRYWQILIEDFDNGDGYVEAGRIHHGSYSDVNWKVKPEVSITIDDTSIVKKSISGQIYADIGVTYQVLDGVEHPIVTNAEKEQIEAMFEDVKTATSFFLVIYPDRTGDLKPIYCNFTERPTFEHIDGLTWQISSLSFEEAK